LNYFGREDVKGFWMQNRRLWASLCVSAVMLASLLTAKAKDIPDSRDNPECSVRGCVEKET
jgi:hypothetical protein